MSSDTHSYHQAEHFMLVCGCTAVPTQLQIQDSYHASKHNHEHLASSTHQWLHVTSFAASNSFMTYMITRGKQRIHRELRSLPITINLQREVQPSFGQNVLVHRLSSYNQTLFLAIVHVAELLQAGHKLCFSPTTEWVSVAVYTVSAH